MRPRAERIAAALATSLVLAASTLRGDDFAWRPAGGAALAEIPLGGALVAALAAEPDGPLFVLVHPEGDVDGPRRLIAVDRGASVRRATIAADLGGWGKALAAIAGRDGAELVLGGLGRLATLGPLAAPRATARDLVLHPGFDLRSLAPARLRVGVETSVAAAEVGALRIWRPGAEGGLALAAQAPLPFAVERRMAGLRLDGVPVVELRAAAGGGRRFAVGPEAATASRLRVLLLSENGAGEWTTSECWAALPAPETVEESWIVDGDDGPWLVVRSQGAVEVNAFENQLWRLFRLAPDRTRAGRRPALAFTSDSKRWHDNEVLVADADGDGRRDLLIARPEGMTGSDLVVERFVGAGGGRFDPRGRRTDLDAAPSDASWQADLDGRGAPGLVTLVAGELVAWRVARDGRRALERDPWLRLPLPRGEGDARAALDLLGVAPRAGAAPDLLVLATPKKGEARLLLVRPPAP
ncbi:MAG: hypothetical protein NDJ75_10430 [Thermoanaerobaculia bacterium]|nr:hypothetical protein [Thermoanaerobaculia bacterium]